MTSFADLKKASDARAQAIADRKAARADGTLATTVADALPLDLSHVHLFLDSFAFRPKFANKTKVEDYDVDETGRYLMTARFRIVFDAGQAVSIERSMRLTPDEYDHTWSKLVSREVHPTGDVWLHVSSTEQTNSQFDGPSVRTTYWIDFGTLSVVGDAGASEGHKGA